MKALPDSQGQVLEVGSGAGYLQDFIPDVIKTEIFYLPGMDAVLDGQRMPFKNGSLSAIVMTDVFHHIPNPRLFLTEAARCIHVGGVIVLNEPWVTPWSRFIYHNLHHEPFAPDAPDWEFPMQGPLSGANGALPWIVFQRDRVQFEQEFRQWCIQRIEPGMPFGHLPIPVIIHIMWWMGGGASSHHSRDFSHASQYSRSFPHA